MSNMNKPKVLLAQDVLNDINKVHLLKEKIRQCEKEVRFHYGSRLIPLLNQYERDLQVLVSGL